MKNMTPMILGLLMMTSVLAGIDFTELEETVVIDETGARSGADPAVIAITTPKETTCDILGCRNELKVGEPTNFAAYIRNLGDADVEEMSYTVTVYLTDSLGAVGNIASDTSGNPLQWENLDAVCDDGSVCDFDSTDTAQAFTPGNDLGGGKLILMKAGNAIEWTPTQGTYIVEVSVDAGSDADIANNVEQIDVSVIDWFDISVELTWDELDAEGNPKTSVTGAGDKGFTLTVEADGSSDFSPRDVEVVVLLSGDATATTVANDGVGSTVFPGTMQTVRTFENESDPSDYTNSTTTMVLDYQTPWTFTGLVSPDGDNNESRYELTAELLGYASYGQFADCEETWDDGLGNSTTWRHFCEVEQTSDDRATTDFSEITGAVQNYHDIRISRMGVYQGYEGADATGTPSSTVDDSSDADLNVGPSRVYALLEHRGTDANIGYGWDVTYSITHDGNNVDSGMVNECMEGIEMPYEYQPLGGMAGQLIATVCVEVNLEPGSYTFDFMLNMDDKGDSASPPGQEMWVGAYDARTSNNDRSMTSSVVNNLPLITSFELVNTGDLIVGQDDNLQLTVTAFDVDDPAGSELNFIYNIVGGQLPCGGAMADGGTLCNVPIVQDYVTDFPVTVVVEDNHGGQVSEELILEIWNTQTGVGETATGVSIEYPLTYYSPGNFTVSTWADADISDYTGEVLPDFSGTYDAVAAVSYAPSTTFSASDVLSQSLSVTVPKDLEATSLWYVDSTGKWVLFSDTAVDAEEDGNNFEVFTYTIPANSPVVPAGDLVLMGGALAQASIPDATISGFDAKAERAGAISMIWNVSGTMLQSDNIVVSICAADANCTAPFTATTGDEDRTYSYSGGSTTHGETYFVTVAVCNEEGCSTPGYKEVVADKEVDGDVSATGMTVEENGETWIVTWTIEGDDSDVAMWHVCMVRGEDFTAATMPMGTGAGEPCESNTMNNTVTIDKPTTAGTFTYYFTAVPMDELGNMDAAGSMNTADYFRAADNTNVNDGNGTLGGDSADDASGDIPMAAWGMIAGVVIIAFVAGAFILSRGDEEGGDKDFDY